MMIKKLFFWLVFLSVGMQAQNNPIDPILNLDAGLKSLLLKPSENDFWRVKDVSGNLLTVDANNDGEIQKSEADMIGYIRLLQGVGYADQFATTIGINQFTNLRGFSGAFLSMQSNNRGGGIVGSIDIAGLQYLEYIDFTEFSVNSVKIDNCAKLKKISSGDPYNYPGHTNFYDLNDCPLLEDITAIANNLESLTIQNCPSVKDIDVSGNKLASLNVSSLLNLEKLHIGNNKLYYGDYGETHGVVHENNTITELDLTNNTKLKDLNCNNNSIISLNLLHSPLLENLACRDNQLSVLDIFSLSKLAILQCDGNVITSLDLSQNPNLRYVTCSNNNMTSINLKGLNMTSLLSPFHDFVNLDCSSNQLTQIDLSSAKIGISDFSSNKLHSVFIKNGFADNVFLAYNADLKYICSDAEEAQSYKDLMTEYGLTNVNINTYCSFTPGGDHNTISGTAKYDADNNGCDVSDNSFEFLKLKINDGTDSGQTFVQNDGNYQFYTQVGNFTVTAQAENPGLFTVAPSTFTTTFSDSNNNIYNQDICVTANGTQNDAEVVIAPLTGARPGFDATYKLVWRNKGNTVLTGKVIMNYDSNLMTFQGSTLPYSALSNGSIQFDYSGLKPFENASTEITFTVNTPTNATNPVNSGDVLAFNAQITPNNTDLTPEDNNFSFRQTVVNSFDPNDITCMEGEIIPSVAVGKYLHYVVNFENTGTAEAENIVVKMAIDPAEFDINTLQLQNASADVTTVITGNQVEFQFRNIKLQSGGHGNVLLKVKSLSALQEGDSVDNQAEIFFDYNFPIATNEYTTTILDANSVLTAKINYTAGNFSAGNYPVSFDGSFSTGGVVSYVWEFSGNPVVSSSTAASPVVTYSLAGYYTAKLTVFDINNNSHSQTISYKIGDVTADLSTGKDSNNNFIAIDSDDDDWKGFDINGTEIKPKVRHTFPGWSFADIGNSKNSQWITLNNTEGYYNYKSRQFTVPDNAADARLNLRSLSFVRNWTYLVQVNPDGTETETEITKTQFLSDGAKGWLNTRSPKVTDYALSPGTYYIKVLVYSNNGDVRESLDVNAVVSCSAGLINANKKAPVSPTLASETVLNNSISIYPIPTNGEVNIIASDVIKTVELYDASGRITQTKRFTSAAKKEKINILGTKGIYYLKVITTKGETTQKIIKE